MATSFCPPPGADQDEIHDPAVNPRHAERMIGSLRCSLECDGYEAEAKTRGMAPHEVRLLAERRLKLFRQKRGPGAQG